jgi:23S rRNA pseudouridine2605 synthase
MPRRNQRGSSEKGSSRTAGGRTGKHSFQGKSTNRADKNSPAGSSGSRSYGAKKSSSARPRGVGKSKGSTRPYKRAESSSARGDSAKGYDRSQDKPFGKPGRFAKSSGKRSSGISGHSSSKTDGPRRLSSGSTRGRSSGTSGSSSASRGGSRSSFPPGERAGRRKEGGKAYGKPYKKSYKPASERPRTGGTRIRIADAATAPKSDKVRLNKFIANSGISSRREADNLIKMGLISVNGQIVSELGYKVNPGDEVRYEEKVLRPEKPVYILMNKPKGFLTTTDDPQERKTVMHIVGSAVKERIYPVGRLDRNTTGLLLLTNDGDLADKLMHPSFNVKKVYKVELDRPLTKADFQTISEGVRLEEGRATVDDLAIVSEDGRTVGIELHIGWNRVVRRIFESLGYEVVKLDRTVYAGLDKKELSRGQWRFLTKEEIIHLKHFK